jgi:hypothetical protein
VSLAPLLVGPQTVPGDECGGPFHLHDSMRTRLREGRNLDDAAIGARSTCGAIPKFARACGTP